MESFLARCEEQLEAFSPGQLAGLPVALARLGAHPGRPWLGSYLDVMQARQEEAGQEEVRGVGGGGRAKEWNGPWLAKGHGWWLIVAGAGEGVGS